MQKKKILVVEDNDLNRELFRTILESMKIEVSEVADGEEALKKVFTHKYDLVILDIQIPKLSGLEVIRKIREKIEYQDLKIVALTAYAMRGDKEKMLEAGFDGYLSKPITLDVFRSEIMKYLEETEK